MRNIGTGSVLVTALVKHLLLDLFIVVNFTFRRLFMLVLLVAKPISIFLLFQVIFIAKAQR